MPHYTSQEFLCLFYGPCLKECCDATGMRDNKTHSFNETNDVDCACIFMQIQNSSNQKFCIEFHCAIFSIRPKYTEIYSDIFGTVRCCGVRVVPYPSSIAFQCHAITHTHTEPKCIGALWLKCVRHNNCSCRSIWSEARQPQPDAFVLIYANHRFVALSLSLSLSVSSFGLVYIPQPIPDNGFDKTMHRYGHRLLTVTVTRGVVVHSVVVRYCVGRETLTHSHTHIHRE